MDLTIMYLLIGGIVAIATQLWLNKDLNKVLAKYKVHELAFSLVLVIAWPLAILLALTLPTDDK